MRDEDPSKKILVLEEEVRALKAALEESHLSEKRFLDALRLSPMALCHHDQDLRYTWLYNAHMGFVQEDVIGKTDWDILSKDLADRMGVIKQRVLETGMGERVEMPTVSGDENSEYFDLVVEPLRDDFTGEVVGLSCSGIDVTEDRRRREAYKASEENLKFIFNASVMPIVVTHHEDGHPLFYNKAADDLFDLSSFESADFFEKIGISEALGSKFEAGVAIEDHMFQYQKWVDDPLYLSVSATRIFYDGEAAVLSTFHDLTRETVYQQHLEEAREKAEQASNAKSQFLASASHDLRQPLHAMGLLLSVLDQHVTADQGRKVLDHIKTSLGAMNDLFSGILDISKLDANAVQVDIQSVNVSDIFKVLQADFGPVAEDNGLDLRFIPTSLSVKSDALQLERLLRNLVSNALRYTVKGRVLVGCRRRQGGQLEICVLDTGIGIAKDELTVIFEEFRQVDNPERDRRKGLGLGLAICERTADLLKTRVKVRSEKGRGSMFSFNLDIWCEENTALTEEEISTDISLEGRTVLFIEDERDVRTATKYVLDNWGCKTLVAASLTEAQELLRDEALIPDVIVADYRLCNEENGLDAILTLRQELGRDIPALVASGDTATELLKTVKDEGLDLLSKPILSDQLKRKIQLLLGRKLIK